jgi:hypothetical protein
MENNYLPICYKMNITVPVKGERPLFFQKHMGNAGNGGTPNPPTIVPQQPGSFPRVNLNPVFRIGAYNNAEESFNFPRHNEYWRQQYNTNNPIGAAEGTNNGYGGPMGNAGNGGNETYMFGAGYTPRNFAPYDLSQLGAVSGMSQTYAYNKNATHVEGGVERVWNFPTNLNMGQESEVLEGAKRPSDAQLVKASEAEAQRLISQKPNVVKTKPNYGIDMELG